MVFFLLLFSFYRNDYNSVECKGIEEMWRRGNRSLKLNVNRMNGLRPWWRRRRAQSETIIVIKKTTGIDTKLPAREFFFWFLIYLQCLFCVLTAITIITDDA